MSGLIEQLGLLFGGGNLYDGPPMEAHSESNVPRERANVPPERARVPTYAEEQARARAAAKVDSGTGRPQPARKTTLDAAKAASAKSTPPPPKKTNTPVRRNLGPNAQAAEKAKLDVNGRKVLGSKTTFTDSSGNKIPKPEGYEWDKTKSKWKKVLTNLGKPVPVKYPALSSILKPLSTVTKVANPVLAALTSENLGRPEDLEKTEMWAWANGTEGFVSSTWDVRNELDLTQSEYDKESTQAIAVAEENLKIMREVDASPEMIAGAEKNLADVKASAGDAYGESAAATQEELDNINRQIAQTFERYGPANAAMAKSDAEGSGLFRVKGELEAKLNDISLIQKQQAEQKAIDNLPEEDKNSVDKVIKLASGLTPDQLRSFQTVDEEDEEEVTNTVTSFFAGLIDGIPFKDMMEGAVNALGELWDDKAIQNAFVYYMGSRLMGYSASGSGMAAGQVLLKGWDNQADADLLDQTATAKAAENDAVDMSKTVNYVDKYGNFQKVYASKNGKSLNHPKLGTIDVSKTGWRPAATGEKDRQTRKLDATDSVNRIQDQILNRLNTQTKNADGEGMYDKGNVAKVTQMFQEAGLSQQMVDSYTDSYGIDGLEKSIPMLRRAMESYSSAVANGEEVKIASLMGHLDRAMITSGVVQVPKSIYHSEGKVVGTEAMNILSERLNKIHGEQNVIISKANDLKTVTEDQKEELKYVMKTEATKSHILIQLNKSFQAIPPKHMDFWKKQAKDSNMSSPFIMWLASSTDPGRQHSSYASLNINVYTDLGIMPSNKKE